MAELVLTAVFAVLMLNLVAAAAAAVKQSASWLLVVLLAGTTGAAGAAVLAVLSGSEGRRFLEVGLVLTGTAAVTAAVRASAARTHSSAGRETPEAEQ